MTGHDALVKMRRAGRVPAEVFVIDGDCESDKTRAHTWHQEPNPFAQKLFAHIRVLDSDIPEALDLRCLVGMNVHLSAERGAARANRLFSAIQSASPRFLIAVIGDEVRVHQEQSNG